MNKTVNINLAGVFFHIDENAYSKLQRYLEAIKRSFTDSQGRSEILLDIEARIAELFNERIKDEKQVISIKEVEEVIAIMGQPEDYLVDEEIFEDEPQPRSSSQSTRKLFRDTENAYIGGVSSGLGHYFDIDPLWIRLAWVVLFFGLGTGILIYILLWILVPAAHTTVDKLSMSGKPINITNIEQKVKEGFSSVKDSIEDVADKVKNKDYSKASNKIKSSSRSFFDALGNIIMFFFTIVAKFIGVILIIVGASTLIALIIALFSVGIADVIHIPGIDFVDAANISNVPIWLVSLILLFAIGIPFFFVFYLGLKILTRNLKSIGKIAKITLLGLWFIAFFALITIGVKQFSEHAYDASVTTVEPLNITANDTIKVSMSGNTFYSKQFGRHSNLFKSVHDENDNKLIYTTDIRLIVRSTTDSVASMNIDKNARGSNYQKAKARAEEINYNYKLVGSNLQLDSYLTTNFTNKFGEQQVELTLYLPEGTILYADENTYSYHRNRSYYDDILDNGMEEHYLQVITNDVICLDCTDDENYKINIDVRKNNSKFKLDEDGLQIKGADVNINIDKKGISGEDEDVKVDIDSSGITIKSKDN